VLYHCYEFGHAAWLPARMVVESYRLLLQALDPLSHAFAGRSAIAACELFASRRTRHHAGSSKSRRLQVASR
jgi:poly-beta-hydroxyalkanoate depolymerase